MQPDSDEESKGMELANSNVIARFEDAELTEDALFDNMDVYATSE
ncbi:hypothetical protein [Exiguobacterium sp. s22]|nr:hypothetical protein [Exiguobacterium sp. s22]